MVRRRRALVNRPGARWTPLGAPGLALAGAGLALTLACAPTPPPPAPPGGELPGAFKVRASGDVRVDDHRVPGGVAIDYLVYPDGRATITALEAETVDFDVISRFIGIETRRQRFRCTRFANVGLIDGAVDGDGRLIFPVGAASISGFSFKQRAADGSCTGEARVVTAENNRALTVVPDPDGNHFSFSGRFHGTVDDEDLDIRITAEGDYVNRPPKAVLGVGGPDVPEELIQGGCPPLVGVNPPAAEANDPEGLRLVLQSLSSDPDGRWRRANLAREQWSHSDGGPFHLLGEGRRIGPVLFEFGVEHRLELTVTDLLGARGRAACRFQVADTTPPTVVAPPRVEVPCSVLAGATPATSKPLRDWLAAATAADLVDRQPIALPPQVEGKDVTPETVLPLDRGGANEVRETSVVFRFRDRDGLIGRERSTVRVVPPAEGPDACGGGSAP